MDSPGFCLSTSRFHITCVIETTLHNNFFVYDSKILLELSQINDRVLPLTTVEHLHLWNPGAEDIKKSVVTLTFSYHHLLYIFDLVSKLVWYSFVFQR